MVKYCPVCGGTSVRNATPGECIQLTQIVTSDPRYIEAMMEGVSQEELDAMPEDAQRLVRSQLEQMRAMPGAVAIARKIIEEGDQR